jgi:hypothetical protein
MRRNPKFWPRMTKWMRANQPLRREVLSRLRRDGALPTSAFDGREAVSWRSTGWTNARNASQMLEFLSAEGRVLVAGRSGQERLWDLTERCVPAKALVSSATPVKLIRDATVRALRSLGVATPMQIQNMLPYAVRDSVAKVIDSLERSGELVPTRVTTTDGALKGRWYIHASDAEKIPALERSWSGRTTLLSPFDTLIRDRARTEALFGMRYRIEIYVPAPKRVHGYYVLPFLLGDALVARVDLKADRQEGVLRVQAAHAEPGAPAETGEALRAELELMAGWLELDGVAVEPRGDLALG